MSPPPPRPAFRVLATLLAVVACGAVLSTAATVIVSSRATLPADGSAVTSADAIRAMPAYRRLAALEAARALIDSVVAPLGGIADDSTVRRLLSSFPPRVRGRANAVPIIPDSMPWPARERPVFLPLLDANEDRRALLGAHAADTATPWLAVWRRFARMAPYPGGWYPPSLRAAAAEDDGRTRALRPYDLYRQLRFLNAVAAAVALDHGRPAEAAARLRENVGAYRHLLGSPFTTDGTIALSAIRRDAARLASLQAAHPAAAVDAADVARVRRLAALTADHLRDVRTVVDAAMHASADPASSVAWELTDDEKLPFGVRAELLYADYGGSCANAREILFGFDDRRVERVARRAADFGRAVGLPDGVPFRRALPPDGLFGGGDASGSADRRRTLGEGLSALLPSGARARAAWCEGVGRR